MNRKLSYEGKELHEMTQEELKNCCNLCYNHFDKLQVITQIMTIQLIVDKEKYPTQRLVCVLFLDNNLHLI
ncbi:MAG: hypothetical protein V8R39_07720 [Clostridia bacterium]